MQVDSGVLIALLGGVFVAVLAWWGRPPKRRVDVENRVKDAERAAEDKVFATLMQEEEDEEVAKLHDLPSDARSLADEVINQLNKEG